MGVQTTQGYRGKLVDKLTGTILDQFSDEDIKVSNNVLDLFDLGEIPGTYTQQITLPGTKKNNAFFEQYYDISVWEPDIFNTNQVVEAYLDFDSFYLVNGYLQLNKVNVIQNKFVDSYEVTLFGIISNFSIDTRASFLTDLSSLSVYNHTSSYENITSSWNRQLFSGDIVYPMAEYGTSGGNALPTMYYSQVDFLGIDDYEGALAVQDYKPAIRVKKVWDAIFNQYGYTYTGSFWNEAWLNDVYMLCDNSLRAPVYNPSIETLGQGRVEAVSGSTPISLTSNVTASFQFGGKAFDYNNAFTVGSSTTYTTTKTTYLSCLLDLAFKVTHTGASGSGMPAWYFYWVNTATGAVSYQTLANINRYITIVRDSRTTTVTETFNLKGNVFRSPMLGPGTYQLKIQYIPYGTNNFTVQLNPDSNNLCAFEVTRVQQAADGQIMDIPANMPYGTSGIRVIDFIRSIQKKFNLIIYPDKLNPNQFVCETFNNWYKQGQIKDFNKYINVQDKISYTPANQLGYRKVRFSDATDADYITTLFKRTNNRTFGESNFYDSGSYYSQGTLEVNAEVIGNGPLGQVPGSTTTGSAANATCTTYRFTWEQDRGGSSVYYTACDGTPTTGSVRLAAPTFEACIQTGAYKTNSPFINVDIIGDCTPLPSTGSVSQFPVWIPYYIADDKYKPAQVLPRLFFYNGLVNASKYWLSGYTLPTTSSVSSLQYSSYPYFDVYSTGSLNGTSSQFPQLNARSLLFNNEQAVWGTTPSGNLVTDYWSTYLELLYNPRTRLVDASAVIGLADYFGLELNDIAEFRGNYYHLRAINDYNLTTGECNVQLLGPIIGDTISSILSGSWAPTPCDFTFTAVSGAISPTFVSASGGVETTSGSYRIHTFTGSANLNVYRGGDVEVLVVAGGGGGGGNTGGGGGAGQLIYSASYTIPTTASLTATVGAGGAGVWCLTEDGTPGGNGSNSSFYTITATGGGGGGSYSGGSSAGEGQNGGSGGGGGAREPSGNNNGGGAISGSYGYDGGYGNDSRYAAGGGGGASAQGGNAGTRVGGAGGNGLAYSFASSSVYYAGGGGGSSTSSPGTGGLGGGGNAGVQVGGQGVTGSANTGGGAGGSGNGAFYSPVGGSGVVIIKYQYI